MQKEGKPMRIGAIVLDSDDSEMLSDFYQKLLGWIKHRIDEEWIVVGTEDRKALHLIFQQIPEYQRPVWPTTEGQQQQMQHIDFYVDDIEKAVAHAIECGAEQAPVQFSQWWRVMLDPAGHPFCFVQDGEPPTQ